jgi:hypothetical protein
MDSSKRNVFMLLRGSTDKQDMETQRTNIEYYCEKFNLKITGEYIYRGVTGTIVHKTPEFQQMLRDLVKDRTVTGIVVSEISRLMRVDEADAFGELKVFRVHKKLIYTNRNRPLEIWEREDRRWIVDKMLDAGDEKELTRFRTQRAKERLIKNPQISITKLPKGVRHQITDKETKEGVYSYTDWAFKHVRPAFERYVSGKESLNTIALSLGFNNETAVRETLNNKWWIGHRVRIKKRIVTYNEETGEKQTSKRVPHETPIDQPTNLANTPLVPVELFNRVQATLATKRTNYTQWQSNTQQFLGTGFLECACGCKMFLKYDARRAKPPVYTCSSYHKRWLIVNYNKKTSNLEKKPVPEPCTYPRMRADLVDAAIWKAAVEYFTDQEWLYVAIARAQKDDDYQSLLADLHASEATLEGLESEKKGILWAIKEDPEDEDAQNMYRDIKWNIADQKIRVATAKEKAQPFGSDDAFVISTAICERFWGSENWTIEQKRAAFAEVVERIRLTKDYKAYFVVRGGLPLQRLRPTTGQYDVPPGLTGEAAAKFRRDQISLDPARVAKLQVLS